MRSAIRTKGERRQVSVPQSLPAPVKGWNTQDPLAAMNPEFATDLDNMFPEPGYIQIRGGTEAYSTGITGTVETLATHLAEDGTETFFAVTDTDCYDISSSGAASAQTWTDQDDGKYQWLNMGDGTNNWLIMFNGVDLPKYYNGTSWVEVTGVTSPAITGVTTTSLIAGCQYNERLFLLEKDSLSFWYLSAGAVGGAATEFDLSTYASRGGYLMWAATWTTDAGDGIDDYIVFMTSEGEAIIYTGTDPSTAANWIRVGSYYLGKPIGRRSFVQFGGDLLAITQEGVFNMAEGLKYAKIDERYAFTHNIKPTFNLAVREAQANFGWDATLYPDNNAIIFNIPFSEESQQYVVNTITGAWCRFTGWDTEVFGIYNDELYFGGSTVVTKAWTGFDEQGSNIVGVGRAAFTNFGADSQSKEMNLYRPLIQADSSFSMLASVDVDFDDDLIEGSSTFTPSTGAIWDTSVWDTGTWGGSLQTFRQWVSPPVSVGYYFAGKVKITTQGADVRWISNDYLFEKGGVIG